MQSMSVSAATMMAGEAMSGEACVLFLWCIASCVIFLASHPRHRYNRKILAGREDTARARKIWRERERYGGKHVSAE
jgi:hypothetical protein